ncbi:M48 family metalloprotease [Aequorivita viscosa]|nr:M48 family metalloprotease [Aequorivita viscosa]
MKHFNFLIFLFAPMLFSQELTPIDTADFATRKMLVAEYKTAFEIFNDKINKEHKGRIKRELRDIYEFSQEEFIRTIEKREFILDARFTEYISTLSDKLNTKLNTNDVSDFKILVSRSNNPNAYCMPGDILVINIGLFRFFNNEEQLLSVICHELGHKQLRHPENTLLSKVTLNNSDALKARLRNIERKKVGQNDEAFALMKNILYSEGGKRRIEEQQADSLGYLLFRKMGLPNSSFLEALYLLKEFDSIPSIEIAQKDYETLFDLPEQPFKEQWLEVEDFSKYNYSFYKEKISADSLKTHPELEERILKLKKDFSELNNPLIPEPKIDSSSTFYKLKLVANQEVITNYIEKEDYGKGIYFNIARLIDEPKNDYLKKLLGQNFLLLYEAKKQYTFNKYVAYVTPEMEDKSYIRYLSFLWNLNLDEMKNISDYYLQN